VLGRLAFRTASAANLAASLCSNRRLGNQDPPMTQRAAPFGLRAAAYGPQDASTEADRAAVRVDLDDLDGADSRGAVGAS
jgi:hypothetical protein